ncbi:hypothetical protein [Rhizobium alvei]|uniref:Transmembrane protein n=1 Tax=Rhizobium alvei TaxID=1132659 RepID=A0ABT8YK13_9HYPH|nr:hypothetical protein [Rhizobium alvei]MDO6963956.1 hypothetical protein [Rhizobium alvei]
MPRNEVLIAWSLALLPGLLLFLAYVFVPRRWLPLVFTVTFLLAAFAAFLYFGEDPNAPFKFDSAIGRLIAIELAVATGLGLPLRILLRSRKR